MTENAEHWRTKLISPRLPWITRPVLPADLGNDLCSVMLSRENMLEDVHYQKVVPNRYRVEVAADNYGRNYQPMEPHVIQQWSMKLAECLATANSRLGRKEYVLAGRVMIEIRAAPDLLNHQARISCMIQQDRRPAQGAAPAYPPPGRGNPPPQQPLPPQPEARPSQPLTACLERYSDGQRFSLYPGVMTLGRLDSCDIVLNDPEVLARRLISGQHAFLRSESGRVRIFDGSPEGRPSLNGTYVNRQRVYATGFDLNEGDVITLAATNPMDPQPNAPGVVSFRFRGACNR